MEYNEYIEKFTLIEEEEVGYLSRIMLDIFVIKKNEFDELNNNILTFKSKLNKLKFLEVVLTNFLLNEKDIERKEKVNIMKLISKINSGIEILEIRLSENPEQNFQNLQKTSERFSKKMQSSVE